MGHPIDLLKNNTKRANFATDPFINHNSYRLTASLLVPLLFLQHRKKEINELYHNENTNLLYFLVFYESNVIDNNVTMIISS